MGPTVLVALIVVGLVIGALARLRWVAARRPKAHHRALQTMGRLAAQHSPGNASGSIDHAHQAGEGPPGQAHVRLVHGDVRYSPSIGPAGLRSGRPPALAAAIEAAESAETSRPALAAAIEAAESAETSRPALPAVAMENPIATTAGAAPAVPAPTAVDGTVEAAASAGSPWHFDAAADPARKPIEEPAHPRRARSPQIRRPCWPRPAPGQIRISTRARHLPLRAAAIGGVAAMVLIVGTAAVIVLSRHHSPGPVSAPPHVRVPAHRAQAPPSTVTPTTVAPTPILVTSTSGYSEYRISGPASISISAAGTCWIEIRQTGPSGQVLFVGDLVAGDTHAAGGSIWVRLGNPSQVTVSVNGKAIAPPSLVAGQPYNLQFV
jgi:hypothetical protein